MVFEIEAEFPNEGCITFKNDSKDSDNEYKSSIIIPTEQEYLQTLHRCETLIIKLQNSDYPDAAVISLYPDVAKKDKEQFIGYKNAITFYAGKEELLELKNAIEAILLIL